MSVGTEAEAEATADPLTVLLPHLSDVKNEDEMNEAALEAFPISESSDATALPISTRSPLPTFEAHSTPSQLPVIAGLPPLPYSPIPLASVIASEFPTLL